MIQKAFRRTVSVASPEDREAIYRLRHQVYASELGQHPENREGLLRDSLDEFNLYLVGREHGAIAAFVSITPPSQGRYSIDKYISRSDLPFVSDSGLFEIRLLTVLEPYRGGPWALLLMEGALRWIEARGGTRVVVIGRDQVVPMYERTGLKRLGVQIRSGRVTYELMSATVAELREETRELAGRLEPIRERVAWDLDLPLDASAPCFHGGASFAAIGDEFDRMERRLQVIAADVLDAWYPPSPGVVRALSEDLPWILRSSPPTGAEGLIRMIARTRGVPTGSIAVGGGSSDLIYRAFLRWLSPSSRVLIPDPSYGEYAHVLERVIGCRVDRLALDRREGYRLDPSRLLDDGGHPWDLIVLVNPNNPTGSHIPRKELQSVLRELAGSTRVWIDETYSEFAGPGESLEAEAAIEDHLVVCKSLSKIYALSGARCAYLVTSPKVAADIRFLTPPWAVSLPAQMAAVQALQDPTYYEGRWNETAALRHELAAELRKRWGVEVLEGCLNSLLVHLSLEMPDAATVVRRCQDQGLFIRNAGVSSDRLGDRAIRIAVKDAETNHRILGILGRVLVSAALSADRVR